MDIEKEVQLKWEREKIFELNAPMVGVGGCVCVGGLVGMDVWVIP